jgi:hypothetical protein
MPGLSQQLSEGYDPTVLIANIERIKRNRIKKMEKIVDDRRILIINYGNFNP